MKPNTHPAYKLSSSKRSNLKIGNMIHLKQFIGEKWDLYSCFKLFRILFVIITIKEDVTSVYARKLLKSIMI
ncbi:Uncharacterised protein [Mycobacteroides abscessus subsp. abscessus]|nr:Uncharacterised protein [Mycobacteroides abscessus subsp. abscessus]